MRRRALLAGIGLGISATAGCVSELSAFDGRDTESPRTSSNDCRTKTPTATEPSAGSLSVEHEVSGDDSTIQYESFSIVNEADSRIGLADYRITFDTRVTYKIGVVTLVPDAELRLVTHGDPSTPSTTRSCPRRVHVATLDLDAPVFEDGRARVVVVRPDGSHLLSENFTLNRSN